jgi:uncharacterized protein (DUF1778 family)
MQPSSTARTKKDRLDIRLSRSVKGRIERAAMLEGRSVTDFVVNAATSAANEAIQVTEAIKLNDENSKLLLEALLNPPNAGSRLRAAAQRYQKIISDR